MGVSWFVTASAAEGNACPATGTTDTTATTTVGGAALSNSRAGACGPSLNNRSSDSPWYSSGSPGWFTRVSVSGTRPE